MSYRSPLDGKGLTGDVLTKKYHKGHKITKAKGCFGNEKTKQKRARQK
jgi:hypothetical protein